MNEVLLVAGPPLAAAFAGAALWLIVRGAAARDLLLPVAVGLAVRAIVMLVAHLGSIGAGDHGFMFLDDRGYFGQAARLAHAWRSGDLANPSGGQFAASYTFGYPALLGITFTLTGAYVLVGKALNVLLSGATVLLVAVLTGRLLGDRARVRAAWMAALLPTLVWWSAPLMKEALTAFLVAVCLVAVTGRPGWRMFAAFGLAFAALVLTRSAAAASVIGAVAGVVLVTAFVHRRQVSARRVGRLALAGVVIVFGAAILQGQGDPGALGRFYDSSVSSQIDAYRTQTLPAPGPESPPGRPAAPGRGTTVPTALVVPLESMHALVSPYPWVFDTGTRTWDRALYPGMWIWYALYPLAAIGLWRWRRRPEAWLIAGVVVLYLAANAYATGFQFRQRSTVEPLILVLAVAGIVTWSQAMRVGAYSLLAVAVAAAAQTRAPLAPACIMAAAGVLWVLAPRISDARQVTQACDVVLRLLRGRRPAVVTAGSGEQRTWDDPAVAVAESTERVRRA
jgi:hypothetical protein